MAGNKGISGRRGEARPFHTKSRWRVKELTLRGMNDPENSLTIVCKLKLS
jgi:hypothetical protein